MRRTLAGLLRRALAWAEPTDTTALAPVGVVDGQCERLRTLVEAADDGLVACDAEGRLLLVNPAAAALLAMPPVFMGAPAEWSETTLLLRPVLERALQDGYAALELEVAHGSRELILEARANAVFSGNGELDGAVLVLRDVSQLRESDAARAENWAALAHDLKTPLNSIGGFTTLLLQETIGPLNALQRDFLRTIEGEGQRLLQSVQKFLEEARDGTPPALGLAPLHLEGAVAEAVERVHALALRKDIQIHTVMPATLPTLHADRERIELVLVNLLDNAISFSPDGGRITVEACEVGESVQVSVEDQGVGIPEESLPLVFGRYYRGPNQPSGSRAGVGLGLAICKQIVQEHGGHIRAESGPAGGARLVFTLPITYRQAQLGAVGASW